ncbi:hypothetical protein PAPHI01_1978 [Pancytospora philotis]|nr:hypothetical protein PAPHI01_1978 [Pancytospora philotis]
MPSLDLSSESVCATGRLREDLSTIKSKFERMVAIQHGILNDFLEINNRLDSEDYEEQSEEPGKRRKKWGNRDYEFVGVSPKAALEDIAEIFEEKFVRTAKSASTSFKKNDAVTCILGKRKYSGIVFSVNDKEVTIKTTDRKKIKISWEKVVKGDIQLLKSRDDNKY